MKHAIYLLLFTVLLSSCGFKLRGDWKEDLANSNVNIKLQDSESLEKNIHFRRQLERYLTLYNLDTPASDSLDLVIDSIERTSFTSAIDFNREQTTSERTLTVNFSLKQGDEEGQSKQYQIEDKQFLNQIPEDPNTSEAQATLVRTEMEDTAARKVTETILKALSNPKWQFENAQP